MGWGTLAAVAGLLALQSAAFGYMISWLRDDLRALREETRAELRDVREELRALREEMHSEIRLVRDELQGEIRLVRDETRAELRLVREELARLGAQITRPGAA